LNQIEALVDEIKTKAWERFPEYKLKVHRRIEECDYWDIGYISFYLCKRTWWPFGWTKIAEIRYDPMHAYVSESFKRYGRDPDDIIGDDDIIVDIYGAWMDIRQKADNVYVSRR